MIKKSLLIALTLVLAVSCVSPKVYKELEGKYANLKKEHRSLSDANEELLQAKSKLENDMAALQSDYDKALMQRDKLQSDYNGLKTNYDNLREKQFSINC
jgi:chemotaxis protein MotB